MFIEIYNSDGVLVFEGLADDFLEANGYDDELGYILNSLERQKYNSIICFYGNDGDRIKIKKITKALWED